MIESLLRIRVIEIYCRSYKILLRKYREEGLEYLVEYCKDGIIKDCTDENLKCPRA